MLVAESAWVHGSSELRTTIFLHRAVRASLIVRRGLRFDSRFACASGAPAGRATIELVREGSFVPEGVRPLDGPAIWRLDERELERKQPGALTFCAAGEPLVLLEITLARSVVIGPVGLREGPRAMSDAARAAMDELSLAVRRRATEPPDHDPSQARDARVSSLGALIDVLVRDGVVTHELAGAVSEPLPAGVERIWHAVSRAYATQNTGAYVDLFAALSGLSTRQVARDVHALVSALPLFGGFRETLRILRLRRAALLLSAADLSVSDVARIVGYGGADAMARAFRDAQLPPPSVVRRGLLASPMTSDAASRPTRRRA